MPTAYGDRSRTTTIIRGCHLPKFYSAFMPLAFV
jgi:hypothetical protein